MDLASKILKALPAIAAAEEPSERWISPLRQSQPAGRNHFVLFLKPEALALEDGVNVEGVLTVNGTPTTPANLGLIGGVARLGVNF